MKTWTHLERQRGGFGFLGGPNETQLELDKRMLNKRIKKLNHFLLKLKTQDPYKVKIEKNII